MEIKSPLMKIAYIYDFKSDRVNEIEKFLDSLPIRICDLSINGDHSLDIGLDRMNGSVFGLAPRERRIEITGIENISRRKYNVSIYSHHNYGTNLIIQSRRKPHTAIRFWTTPSDAIKSS
ncbi:hypothetical protein HOA55_00870 [archaeon]|nr:hypothetical protein [archaeon]MBT3578192.1 hypothetical protein [archaeon]MBT6819887.1 hypothetical protein [archaeon]MBT6956389.1 hypothetical protein [archaeon]MBT7025669.1 hypothetical protein [archaeon]